VKPAPFAYERARSLDHAIELISGAEDARLLAGGQSLIATLNMRLSRPQLIVDINRVPGLDRITLRDAKVEVGALVRYAQAERSAELAAHVHRTSGHPQPRHHRRLDRLR
jgi:aerobic carbon-monoxide dehydrogenase medium subunit